MGSTIQLLVILGFINMDDYKNYKLNKVVDSIKTPQSYRIEEPSPIEEAKDEKLAFKKIQRELKQKYPSFDELNVEFGKGELDPFLLKISKIESDLGKNMNHKTIDKGIHKGDTAIGRYGLMPNTVDDIISNYNNRQSALRYKLGRDYADPELEALKNMSKDEYNQYLLENPQTETRLARYLALMLQHRMQNDPRRMAYGWHQGSSYRKRDISDQSLDDNFYVNRFDSYADLVNSDPRFNPDLQNQEIDPLD